MNTGFIVTGTDTDLGKTVFAAALVHALGADYWKPVQAGLDGTTDTQTVRELASLPPERVHAECYRLNTPCSPHRAAELDNLEIDTSKLHAATPAADRPLVIEGAGGLLVPITRSALQIDVFAIWNLPIILCTRTSLGTINHTLLSIEALRTRGMPLAGIAFIGDENHDTERTICEMGETKRLGRLPWIDPLTPDQLHAAFADGFDIDALKSATHHLEKQR